MIPAGLTPVTDARAAAIFGYQLDSFQKVWSSLGVSPCSRPDAARRIWALEHLLAVKRGEPAPESPVEPDPLDLLDYEELRESLPPVRLDLGEDGELHESVPPMRRPAPSTWKTLKRDGKAPKPDLAKDAEDGVGVDLYYRRTGQEWNAQRRGRGGGPGRPTGATDRRPRKREADLYRKADEHLDQVGELLREDPELTAAQLGARVGLSPEHARRLRAKARAEGQNKDS